MVGIGPRTHDLPGMDRAGGSVEPPGKTISPSRLVVGLGWEVSQNPRRVTRFAASGGRGIPPANPKLHDAM
jgi:hypothetical protein